MYDSFRYIERKKGVYVMNVTIYDVAREAKRVDGNRFTCCEWEPKCKAFDAQKSVGSD